MIEKLAIGEEVRNMWETIVMVAGLLATPVLAIAYVPQIVSLVKTKNAEGISTSFWYILDTSLLMLFILSIDTYIQTGSVSLLVAQGLNLGLALINTFLVLKYKSTK